MSKLVDNLITLRMLRLFTVKYEDTEAYKQGIINDKGEQLIKMRNFTTSNQSNAYTLLHRLVFRLRGLLEKVPFVKSRLANYAAALLLIREKIVKEEEFWETDDVLLEKLDAAEHRPGFYLAEQQVRKAWEDAAANSTGPAVAGTGGTCPSTMSAIMRFMEGFRCRRSDACTAPASTWACASAAWWSAWDKLCWGGPPHRHTTS